MLILIYEAQKKEKKNLIGTQFNIRGSFCFGTHLAISIDIFAICASPV